MSQHASVRRPVPAGEAGVPSPLLRRDADGVVPEVAQASPGGRDFSRVPVRTDSPQEAEAAQISARLVTGGAPTGLHGGTARGPGEFTAPPAAVAVLGRPGRPLGGAELSFYGPRLSLDLSQVRLHTGPAADTAVKSVGAKAFTVGEHVVLGSRHWSPHSASGRKLLAHELTHVGQHRRARGDAVLRREPEGSEAELRQQILENEQQLSNHSLPPEELVRLNDERNALLARLRAGRSTPPARAGGAAQGAGTGPQRIPVEVTYELIQPIEPDASAGGGASGGLGLADPAAAVGGGVSGGFSLADPAAAVGGGASGGFSLADSAAPAGGAPGGFTPAAPVSGRASSGFTAEGLAAGTSAASGEALLRFLDPLPGTVAPGTPNVYTRFVGPETAEGFFEAGRFSGRGDFRPRLYQAGQVAEREAAFALFRQRGITYPQLNQLSRALRAGGVSALTQEQAALLRVVTEVHATVAGSTPHSPLLSLTELEPAAALKKLPRVATQRAWLVRVRISPNDVIRVNEILRRAGQSALASEQEIVVAMDLSRGAGARGPQILSITANQAPGAPLAGRLGTGLRWAGKAFVVAGAAMAAHEVVTAKGPNRRETQGRAFGGFAGATAVGAFGAGLCIGLGVATAGVGLALCGLGFGLAGMLGGSWVGGRIGRAFD